MYKRYGRIAIDQESGLFKIVNGSTDGVKKHGFISNASAVMTFGMSRIAENTVSGIKKIAGNAREYPFEDLISFDLMEDNSTVASGGVGRAIVGDILAGPVGALVGASTRSKKALCSNMAVVITVSDSNHPLITIPLITKPVKHSSKEYVNALNEAQKTIAALNLISSLVE